MSEFLGWLVNVMLFFFVFFFVPASIVTLIAYFSKAAEKRKIWQHIFMLIFLMIGALIFLLFATAYHVEIAIIEIDGVMIAATSLLVFSILCLITLRKVFLLRTQYWFRKLFHYDLSQKDFGKPIINNWLISLMVISVLTAYFTGLSYNIQQFFLHDYRAHTLRANIFSLIYDFAMYYIWRSLLFVKKK